jgi:hypothetical protein
MSKVIAHADAGSFYLEVRYQGGAWEWTVFNLSTGANGTGESLEKAKSHAEEVAGAKPKCWYPIGRPVIDEPDKFRGPVAE